MVTVTAPGVPEVKHAAVLGAGIMGGGVAYQSASKGTPIIMKDIAHEALELGMGEAQKLLGKQLKRGKIDVAKMAQVISMITPTLSYGDFGAGLLNGTAVSEMDSSTTGGQLRLQPDLNDVFATHLFANLFGEHRSVLGLVGLERLRSLFELLLDRLPHDVDGLPLPQALRTLAEAGPPSPAEVM